MVGYEVELKGFEEQAQRLGAEAQMVEQEFRVAMNVAVVHVDDKATHLAPSFQSHLRGSIGGQVTSNGMGSVVGTVGSDMKAEIYPSVMEFGRRAGSMPPVNAPHFRLWVKRIIGDESLAFVVARSIARKGIQGKEFMKRGGEASKAAVEGFFAAAVERIANRLAGK